MKFADYVCADSLCVPLTSHEARFAIHEMVWALDVHGHIPREHSAEVIAAILQREALGSTGIGRGIAVPHAKHPAVKKLIATFGNHPRGIEFNSLDGRPVRVCFLILSPPDRPGEHLRALESLSRALRDTELVERLADAETGWEVVDLLNECDAR